MKPTHETFFFFVKKLLTVPDKIVIVLKISHNVSYLKLKIQINFGNNFVSDVYLRLNIFADEIKNKNKC